MTITDAIKELQKLAPHVRAKYYIAQPAYDAFIYLDASGYVVLVGHISASNLLANDWGINSTI
jgi:hypothetical protein